jgi:hypothetical protein
LIINGKGKNCIIKEIITMKAEWKRQ